MTIGPVLAIKLLLINNKLMIPANMMKEEGNNRAQLIKNDICDLQRIDERVKHGIRSIKERLRAAKDADCNACPLLQAEVQRQERQSKEKDKHITQLHLKLDRISQQQAPFTGPHSARKADLQARRETLTRNANALLSARKPPIQEIYRIEERLPQEMEELRSIEERTQLLRSKEKKQREVIKRLSSIKANHRSELSPNRPKENRYEEEETSAFRKDDTLRSFRERLGFLEPSHEEDLTSELQGVSFTTINDRYNSLNVLIGDLKTTNETLTARNSFLEKEANKLKEQLIQKDSQLITLNEEKTLQEKQTTGRLVNLTDSIQDLERQHQGCKRNLQYYQSKSAGLEDALMRDRQKYEQQLSNQADVLTAAMGKVSEFERTRNEKDELKAQLKEEVIRRLALIEQINILNKENYSLKLSASTLTQQSQDLAARNQQLNQLANERSDEIKSERAHHAARIMESEKIRNSLEGLCQKLQQKNESLKSSNISAPDERKQSQLSETIKFLQEKVKRVQNQLTIKQTTIDTNEKTVSELKWQVNKLTRNLEQQTNSARASESNRNAFRSEVGILTQRCQNLTAELQQIKDSSQKQNKLYSDQLLTLIANIEALQSEAVSKDNKLNSLMKEVASLKEENTKLINVIEQGNKNHQQSVQQIKQQLKETLRKKEAEVSAKSFLITNMSTVHKESEESLRNAIQKLNSEVGELNIQNKRLRNANELLQSQSSIIKHNEMARNNQNEAIIEQLLQMNKSNQQQIDEIRQKLEQTNAKKEQYEHQFKDMSMKLDGAQAQLTQSKFDNQGLCTSINKIQRVNEQLRAVIETSILQKQASNQKIRSLQATIQLISTSHENQLKYFNINSDNFERQINELKNKLQEKENQSIKIINQQQVIKNNDAIINQQLVEVRKSVEDAGKEKRRLQEINQQRECELIKKVEIEVSLRNQIQILKSENKQIQNKLKENIEQSQKFNDTQSQKLQINNKISQMQQQHHKNMQQTMEKYEDQIKLINIQNQEIVKYLKQDIELLNMRNLDLIKQYDQKIIQITRQVENSEAKQREIIQINSLLEHQINQKIRIINKITEQLTTKEQVNEELKKQMHKMSSEILLFDQSNKELGLKCQQIQEKLMQVSSNFQNSKTTLERVNGQLLTIQLQQSHLLQQLQQSRNSLNESRIKNVELQNQCQKKREEILSLRSMSLQISNKQALYNQLQHQNQKLKQIIEKQILSKKILEQQIIQLKNTNQMQTINNQERQQRLGSSAEEDKSHIFEIQQLQANIRQMAKKLQQSEKDHKRLQQQYAQTMQTNEKYIKQLQTALSQAQQKLNQRQAQLRQKQSDAIVFGSQIHSQKVCFEQTLNNNEQLITRLNNQLSNFKAKFDDSQRQVQQKEQKMQKYLKQYSQAIQMLQQEIIERQVEIQHKDKKYLIQITNKTEKIEALGKQIKETKKVLQEELVERQNCILSKQKQIETINANFKRQLQTLKLDSEKTKRILQVQLAQRQTEISDRDIKIIDLQSKSLLDIQTVKQEMDEAKRLLQEQIVQRQTQISDKDLKMCQMESRHAGQLNKVIQNYEKQKRLLQQLIIQRQTQIMEYDLKFNEILLSNLRQKEVVIAELQGRIKQAQSKQIEWERQLSQARNQILRLFDQNERLKTNLKEAISSVANLERQNERLKESHEISQNQSGQNLQKMKNLEQSLMQKQNIILECLAENQTTLFLALESVHQKSSQVGPEKEESLACEEISDMKAYDQPVYQSEEEISQENFYKARCEQLQGSIKIIHSSYQSSIDDLQRKQILLNNAVETLNGELMSYQRSAEQSKHTYTNQIITLKINIQQLSKQLIQANAQIESNTKYHIQQINVIKQQKIVEIQQLLQKQQYQKSIYQRQNQTIVRQNSEMHSKLQEKSKQLKDLEQKLQQNNKKYDQSQSELYQLQGIFINHKIRLEELKIQNTTLKERLEKSQIKTAQHDNQNREIIDESEELIEELIEEILKKYQQYIEVKERKLLECEERLNKILESLLKIKRYMTIIRKNQVEKIHIQYKSLQQQLQQTKIQLKDFISNNSRLQNELTLSQLNLGQIMLQKDDEIVKLYQQIHILKNKTLIQKSEKVTTRQGKIHFKPVSSFKLQEHEHMIQQTPENDLYSQGSLIDPLRDLAQSPENESAAVFPSQQDVFNLITLYLGDFEQGVHELRHEYKQLLLSKCTILHFIERLLIQTKKKNEIDMEEAIKKQLVKVKSEEFIAPSSLPNIPIQTLLEKSSNNSSHNKFPLLDSPIVEIEEEDGQAPITEIKPKYGSQKRMSLMLAHNISEVFSDSEKNDEIQEMLGMSSPGELEMSHKSESAKLIGSQLSLKSSKSAKESEKHYNQKMKNSLMMAKLRKKK